MPKIHVQTESVGQAASDFSTQSVQLGDVISAISKTIDQLQPLWQGQAADQFNTLMDQWNKDITDIKSLLDQIAKRVDDAHIGYSDLDDQIRKSFTVS